MTSPVEEPADARLLAALRREDLVGEVTDPALAVALQQVNDELRSAVTALARRLYGRATRDAIERTTCAVIDLPQGAIRRHLVQGVAVPRGVRSQLAAAIRAALLDRPASTGKGFDMSDDVDVVRRLFAAVEDRDFDRVLDCYSDDVEITEAEVLPYGGVWRGREGAAAHAEAFMRAWGSLAGSRGVSP